MERMSSGCTLPTRMTLVILVLFSVSSWCEQDTFRAPAEAKFESGVSGDAITELKRYEDIDYDSFVSLMGRRSAAQPNRPMDHILSALLGQRTKLACDGAKEDSQATRSPLTYKRQRF